MLTELTMVWDILSVRTVGHNHWEPVALTNPLRHEDVASDRASVLQRYGHISFYNIGISFFHRADISDRGRHSFGRYGLI
jgi:hypothetical protein